MNCYDNFKPRCTVDEVLKVYGEIPIPAAQAAYTCYKAVCRDKQIIPDFSGLCTVYTLGFLSGCREMKERSRKRDDIQTKRNRA